MDDLTSSPSLTSPLPTARLPALALRDTPPAGSARTPQPMPGTAPVSSPQAALSTSRNSISPSPATVITKPTEPAKPTEQARPNPKKRKPAKQTKSKRPAKWSRKASTPLPPVDNDNEGNESDEWFAIRDIVDEKVERGVRQYFVDWADHPVTGEVYPKSWVSFGFWLEGNKENKQNKKRNNKKAIMNQKS